METYFFLFRVFLVFMYFLVSTSSIHFLRLRACVLRDLTNEHKVTKFEQEEEHDNEVGCQDEMPRILFPLPAPARACVLRDPTSSSCARALVCCVMCVTWPSLWRRLKIIRR